MAKKSEIPMIQSLAERSDLFVAVGVVVILLVMLIPMPPLVIDLLLVINFLTAFIILLSPLYILRPSDFSVFPGVLLVVTLFRLSLNVATTRLILGNAYAGKVVEVFGGFMISGNYVVGLIIFMILFIINFKVITNGSGRVAEVAARFTLDAMPGKQMAVDADLNNGVITEEEARERREAIRRDADFYGAMDGASKFVKGDAVAGLIITSINILGGIIIGVWQLKMPFMKALSTYTVLTVGDGIVSQIPSLLISTSAGIIVTRAGTKSDLGTELMTQLAAEPKVMIVAGSVLILFGFAPGMPWYFFIPIGIGVIFYALKLRKSIEEDAFESEQKSELEVDDTESSEPEDMTDYLQVDPLELELGYSLLSLVDEKRQGDLLQRITSLRKEIAMEAGVLIPLIRVRDNIALVPNQYVIKIRGEEISSGECLMNHFLALDSGGVEKEIKGIPAVEPAFGLPALWISEDKKEIAEMHGYTVIEPGAMIATHLSEVIKSNADQIITRQDVQKLLDNVKKENEAVVNELVPGMLSLGSVEQVLKALLHESVPIRDMVTILETLADYAPFTRETETLTEYVRFALARTIAKKYTASDGTVYGITLAPVLERMISEVVINNKQNGNTALSPEIINNIYNDLREAAEEMNRLGLIPLVMVAPSIRVYFRKLIEPVLPQIAVVSYNEIPTHLPIKAQLTIDAAEA
ncbi:MAG: flagellar biosynthesis protein FlhA [Candidatus Cloacimonadota bacterium]|nr:MAG: flagellar biosynthesis protein FlhA [Candidatus Cloacimonadota bacterium]